MHFKNFTDCLLFQDENIEFYAPSTSPMVPEIVVSQFYYLGVLTTAGILLLSFENVQVRPNLINADTSLKFL